MEQEVVRHASVERSADEPFLTYCNIPQQENGIYDIKTFNIISMLNQCMYFCFKKREQVKTEKFQLKTSKITKKVKKIFMFVV